MKKTTKKTIITLVVLIAVALLAPVVVGLKNNYMINILCSYCYFGILCCSLNLLLGYTGQISMGHAAFMMIGAYTYGILNKFHGVHFLPSALAALAVSFAAGLLLGAACCKLNAIFLAMTTVGFYKAVSTVIINEGWLTGGANGISAIQKWTIFGYKLKNWQFYYIALAVVLLVFLFCYRMVNSKTGRAMRAMCSAPIASSAMGVNNNRLKFLVCGISGALAGLAGVLYAVTNSYLSADMFAKVSIQTLTMTVVGGMGTLWGPLFGTLTIATLPELLRPFAEHLDGIYGIVIILTVIFMPNGIYGFARRMAQKAAAKAKAKKAQPVSAAGKKGE